MKFLVDNQLPVALARFLCTRGHEAQHVLDLRMDEATDRDIWNYAAMEERVVVSKDEDFLHLANQSGSQGMLVWVRLGNCRKGALLTVFDRALAGIVTALENEQRVIELR